MDKKIRLALFSAFAVLVLGGIALYVFNTFYSSNTDDGDSTEYTTDAQDLTYKDMAAQILRWMETQRDDNGIYYISERCIGDNCDPYIDHRAGYFAIWARANYYREFGGEEHLDLIERDLDVYRDSEIVPDVQNYYWICATLLDIAQDETFPARIRSKSQLVCERSFYMPTLIEEADAVAAQNLDYEVKAEIFVEMIQGLDLTGRYLGDKDQLLYQYTAYASDFFARYGMYDIEENQDTAEGLMMLALDEYTSELEEGRIVEPETSCMIAASALDAYESTSSEFYLDISQSLVELTDKQNLEFEDTAYCLYAKTRMIEETRYRFDNINDDLKYAIDTWFDYPGLDGYHGGNGVFASDNDSEILRSLPENALMLYVLLDSE